MRLSRVQCVAGKGRRHALVDCHRQFTDDFNRADSALSAVGWSVDLQGVGSWNIVSGQAVANNALNGQWAQATTPGVDASNQWCEAEAANQGVLSEIWSLQLRSVGKNTGYLLRCQTYQGSTSTDDYGIQQDSSGIASRLEPIIVAPYRVRFEVFGWVMKGLVWQNARWRVVVQATVTSRSSGSVGMMSQTINSNNTHWDNFYAGTTGR